MPGDDGLRLDDYECRSPSGPDARELAPEPTVRLPQLQPPRPGALQHVQLVAQGQHLELERGARPRPCAEGLEEGLSTGGNWRSDISYESAPILIPNPASLAASKCLPFLFPTSAYDYGSVSQSRHIDPAA